MRLIWSHWSPPLVSQYEIKPRRAWTTIAKVIRVVKERVSETFSGAIFGIRGSPTTKRLGHVWATFGPYSPCAKIARYRSHWFILRSTLARFIKKYFCFPKTQQLTEWSRLKIFFGIIFGKPIFTVRQILAKKYQSPLFTCQGLGRLHLSSTF